MITNILTVIMILIMITNTVPEVCLVQRGPILGSSGGPRIAKDTLLFFLLFTFFSCLFSFVNVLFIVVFLFVLFIHHVYCFSFGCFMHLCLFRIARDIRAVDKTTEDCLPAPARLATRKEGWHGWKPSSSSNFSIRAFRAYPLIEIRQTVPCRAIRGNSISVNCTLPPLSHAPLRTGVRLRTGTRILRASFNWSSAECFQPISRINERYAQPPY